MHLIYVDASVGGRLEKELISSGQEAIQTLAERLLILTDPSRLLDAIDAVAIRKTSELLN